MCPGQLKAAGIRSAYMLINVGLLPDSQGV